MVCVCVVVVGVGMGNLLCILWLSIHVYFLKAANAKAANASAVVWGRGASEAGSLPPTTRVYSESSPP